MNEKPWLRILIPFSGNLKSAIQNPKWWGIFACVLTFAFGGATVHAQQPKRIPRIGYLSPYDAATESARSEPYRRALRELGYIEGQNIVIEYRYGEGNDDRLPGFAAELVRLKVDIIVAGGGDPGILAVKNATKTIPIVLTGGGGDPVEAGYVQSLAHPGGNITGLTFLNRALGGKRLDLLKETFPRLSRVAVLYDPTAPSPTREVKEDLPVAAQALKLTIQPWHVRAADDFDKIFGAIGKQPPDGLYVAGAGQHLFTNRKRIAAFALKNRLPSIYVTREFVDAGGLMYYGADRAESYRRVAYFVDKILKGAKPADLPVEQPKKFELIINLKAAKQIGLTIPPTVLARADRVIK